MWTISLRVIPLTLRQANAEVLAMHRHHKPVQGHRFSIGAMDGDRLCGAAIVGRPVSRTRRTDQPMEPKQRWEKLLA